MTKEMNLTMKDRKEITRKLSLALEEHIDPDRDTRVYWAKKVSFGFGSNHGVRADYMLFKPLNNSVSGIEKGDFYCYEVKSSAEDFHSPNGHNYLGDYNYYVMPEDVYQKVSGEIPFGIGVYVLKEERDGLVSVKQARRRNRERPVSEMLLMMLRSAMRDVKTKAD